MSDNVPSEQATLATLARLVHHLGDELAGYRKRALSAESRLKAYEERDAGGGVSVERSIELQHENAELQARLGEAKRRVKLLIDRLRFLQQQRDGVDAV